jgi:hypothetical protein
MIFSELEQIYKSEKKGKNIYDFIISLNGMSIHLLQIFSSI